MFTRFRTSRTLTFFVVAVLLCLSALACASCGSTTPTLSKEKQDALQETLNSQMAKYKVPGAIVGMWFPDEGAWVVVAGKGDKKTGAAPKTTDKVRVGSLTKTFTATVVLQLVDEGKLNLDDKLSTSFHKYAGIRPPLHPLQLRSAPSPYYRVRLGRAPCRSGAPTFSIRHRIYETKYLANMSRRRRAPTASP